MHPAPRLFEAQIGDLDPALFTHVPSQSTPNDQRSLLALHLAAREGYGTFSYLEIGSHIGGSMQALIADPACTSILSIDPRPKVFPDERGFVSEYPENSTQRMLDYLAKVPGADFGKLKTIDSDAQSIGAAELPRDVHFCFIDAEHTDEAALRDAQFCLKVVRADGCIAFHDANVVFGGINTFLKELEAAGRPFKAYLLPDAVFVVELGEGRLIHHARVMECFMNSWKGYMFALKLAAWYRNVLNKPVFRLLRRTRFVRRLFIVAGQDD